MSYQILRAKPPELQQNSADSESVIIAESAHIPAVLREQAMLLSKATAQTHSAFAYTTLDSEGSQYHILSVFTAKKPGHPADVVHQLILTEEEVKGLQNNQARPTPAGIIQAFRKNQYWVTHADASTHIPEGEPRLSASELPDASTQHYWKKLTGHKGNARIYCVPPYDKKNLSYFPSEFTAEDVLLLLHESQWLMPTRGWGNSFSIGIRKEDFIAEHAQIIGIIGAIPPEEHSANTQNERVCLYVNNIHLSEETEATTDAATALPQQQTQQEPDRNRPSDTPSEPYKYAESPDYETFDIPVPGNERFKYILYCSALILLAGLVYSGISLSIRHKQPSDNSEEPTPRLRFQAIINMGNEAEDKHLKSLEDDIRRCNSSEYDGLLDCIHIISEDSRRAGGHPTSMLFLLRHADSLGVSRKDLCCFYLSRVIDTYQMEEWIKENTSKEEIAVWRKLFTTEPALKQHLATSPTFREFMQPIITKAEKHP